MSPVLSQPSDVIVSESGKWIKVQIMSDYGGLRVSANNLTRLESAHDIKLEDRYRALEIATDYSIIGIADNRSAVNRSAVNRSAVNQSAVNRSAVNQSAVNRSAVNQSAVNRIFSV